MHEDDIDSRPLSGSFITFYVDWKFLIIALMVEMEMFTALALFLKPLNTFLKLIFCCTSANILWFLSLWWMIKGIWADEWEYTLTGHFIRYTLLLPGWTHVCLQNCLNSSWHRFNEVLKTFLRDFGPYWHYSITQLLQICRLHIHDANLPFHHIPKVLYWIEIWWLWRPFE